jgi:cytochrome oxidase assembly protein ShyY1
MLFSIVLGLALFAIACYLVLLFFQVQRVEKQITDLIQMVETHLLNKYGHNPNRQVKQVNVKKALKEIEEG